MQQGGTLRWYASGHEHKNSKEALHLDLGISSWHASATGQGQTFVASPISRLR